MNKVDRTVKGINPLPLIEYVFDGNGDGRITIVFKPNKINEVPKSFEIVLLMGFDIRLLSDYAI